MYSTAGHRQERRTKHGPQQAQRIQQKHKKPQTLKLPNLEIQCEKINYELQEKCQMMAKQDEGFNTVLTNT